MIINVYWSSCKVPVTLARIELNSNILNRLSKNTQISNFMEVRSVGAELFLEDGWTDRQT